MGAVIFISPDTTLISDVFAFDEILEKLIIDLINYSRNLKDNDLGVGLTLNYDRKTKIFRLGIYTPLEDLHLFDGRNRKISRSTAMMYIRTMLEEKLIFRDFDGNPAVYKKIF